MNMDARSLNHVLIQPFKQIKIGLYFIVLSIVFMLATGFVFFQITYEQHANVMKIFNVVDSTTRWDLLSNDVVLSGLVKISVLLIGYMIITLLVSITLTHRIYGPLVSINKFIQELSEGNYSKRVTIRKKDELRVLAAQLNNLAEQLETRHPDNKS